MLEHKLGSLQSYSVSTRGVLLECQAAQISIGVLSPTLIRVRLAPGGVFAPRRSWAVARADEEFAECSFSVEEGGEALEIRTEALTVRVERESCAISFVDGAGQSFCADHEGMSWGPGGLTMRWGKQQQGPAVHCAKRIDEGEHFYGFGERTGQLDKLSRAMVNWTSDPPSGHGPGTDPLYIAIPTLLSLCHGRCYGIFFNNSWYSSFDMGRERPGTWSLQASGGELDYYLIYGPEPSAVCAGLGQILGTMPMPPRWALGYHQSRWSYESSTIVQEMAREFRARKIPCDVIHFDIDYMHGYRVFTWDPTNFANPRELLDELRRSGFHSVAIIDPGVKIAPGYHVYQQGMQQGHFITKANGETFHGYVWPDDAVFADYTRPEVREWWGTLQQSLVNDGVEGIWNDMNEPTVFALPFSEGGGPPLTIDLDAPQGPPEERTTHAEVHNLYGLGMAQASYEGLRRHLGGKRPFVLTRSAFAGIQRWSACWMGDNSSWWEHLEVSMPQLLNMGLSGVPFVGVDIGGFFGNASGELFARWIQLGALLPFCRGHSAIGTERHEPWVYGPQVEAISRKYLLLRYRLLPYLYTLFWQAHRHGTPILRPLFLHHPDDPATYQLHDQLMLGPALLAAPIYHPGREHRQVYLPAGSWYDWWSDERHEGPLHLLAHAPLDTLPLYVRAGAIIPCGPEMEYTGQKPLDPLALELYPGDGELTLYEDDGESLTYEQDLSCTTHYHMRLEEQTLHLEIGARQGVYLPAPRRVEIRVHRASKETLKDYPGAEFDDLTGVLSFSFKDDGQARTLAFRVV